MRLVHSALFVSALITAVRAAASVDDKARIALACLLGGVPTLSILVFICFCCYVRKRKAALRQHALDNGIELDEDGWPLHPALRSPPTNHTNSQSHVGEGRASSATSQTRQQPQVRRFSLGGGRVDDFIIRSYAASGIDTKYVPPYYRTNPVQQAGSSPSSGYPPRTFSDTKDDRPTTAPHAY